MTTLQLWFLKNNDGKFGLEKTSYFHPENGQELVTVRGRPGEGCSGQGQFRWSPAVQALAYFFLRSLTATQTGASAFEGEAGSPATSLDYAMVKEPSWLLDMFGVNEQGSALIKSIIIRNNSQRKRPGPVTLTLNEKLLPASSIQVFINSESVSTETLNRLKIDLEHSWKPLAKGIRQEGNSKLISHQCHELSRPVLHQILSEEVAESLRNTNIFNRQNLSQAIHRVTNDPFFMRIAGKHSTLLSEIDQEVMSTNRLGASKAEFEYIREILRQAPPFRIAVSPANVGAIVLLTYLKTEKELNIEIDYGCTHDVGITRQLINGEFGRPPDACLLHIGSVAPVINDSKRCPYRPLMVMPQLKYRIVRSNRMSCSSNKLDNGTYLFINNTPSTASFFFEQLLQTGELSRNKIKILDAEPDETTSLLCKGEDDVRGLLWFPYDRLNQRFNNCEVIDPPSANSFATAYLLVHESHLRNKTTARCLDIALRDAWLSLVESPCLLTRAIDSLLKDSEYVRRLLRYGGINQLPNLTISEQLAA